MKPCFGYIRVSTARQGDGASLEAQKDAIAGFASQNNLTITEWYEEQESAAKAGRPVFDAMMRALARGQADGVVMHKIDRSSRNYADWARLDEVSRLGVKVFFAADSLDFDTRGGRLLADIQMALAADYSRNLSLEVKKGLYGRVKHGIYPFRAPLGYLDTGGGNLKTIDPIKGPLVRLAFELYGTGEYSLTSLTEEMRRRGLKGYGDRPVVRRNIDTMLRNPFYCGQMLVGGKLYPGAHEPLVSVAAFQRIAAVKAGRTQKKSTKHTFLYRGLLHCAACGGVLSGERQKTHCYYRCHTRGCGEGTIREDRLTEQVVAALRQLTISNADKVALTERLKSWLADDGSDAMERSVRLRIADTTAKTDRLTDLLVDGAIAQPDYNLRKQNLEFELAHLREELARATDRRKQEADLAALLEFTEAFAEVFLAAPHGEKRQLLRNTFAALQVSQGILDVQTASWLTEVHEAVADPTYTPKIALLQSPERNLIHKKQH